MTFPVRRGKVGVSRSNGTPYVLLQCEEAEPDKSGRIDNVRLVLEVSEVEDLIEMLQLQVRMIRRAPCSYRDGATLIDEYQEDKLQPLFPPPAPYSYDELSDCLYVSRSGAKIVTSVAAGEEYTSDLIKNLDSKGRVVGLQFIGTKDHAEDWFLEPSIRKSLPKDLVAAVDRFYLGPWEDDSNLKSRPGSAEGTREMLGLTEEQGQKVDAMVNDIVAENPRQGFEGGAMVAYMVKPNPEAARDEHRRVKALLDEQEGAHTKLVECGTYGCKRLKADALGSTFCKACYADYLQDPDAYK